MALYNVIVRSVSIEAWPVEAKSAKEARQKFNDGDLINADYSAEVIRTTVLKVIKRQ